MKPTDEQHEWILSHGGYRHLRANDVAPLNAGTLHVFRLLKDMKPHTRPEIEDWVGALEAMRRKRDLAAWLRSVGFDVETRRVSGRLFSYRIVRVPEDRTQAMLFDPGHPPAPEFPEGAQ